MWAAENGDADCARPLLDAGADTKARDDVRMNRCILVENKWIDFVLNIFHGNWSSSPSMDLFLTPRSHFVVP